LAPHRRPTLGSGAVKKSPALRDSWPMREVDSAGKALSACGGRAVNDCRSVPARQSVLPRRGPWKPYQLIPVPASFGSLATLVRRRHSESTGSWARSCRIPLTLPFVWAFGRHPGEPTRRWDSRCAAVLSDPSSIFDQESPLRFVAATSSAMAKQGPTPTFLAPTAGCSIGQARKSPHTVSSGV
jgi:hypothetical protein